MGSIPNLAYLLLLQLLHSTSALIVPQALNSSISSIETSTKNGIECFSIQESLKTSVSGCRPTLQYMKTIPKRNRVQEFLERVRPKEPEPPPIQLAVRQGDCSIEISSHEQPDVSDRFSWEDVRLLAQDILETCQEPEWAGTGGEAPIGPKQIWKVTVKGWRAPDSGVEGDAAVIVSGAGLTDDGTGDAIVFQR